MLHRYLNFSCLFVLIFGLFLVACPKDWDMTGMFVKNLSGKPITLEVNSQIYSSAFFTIESGEGKVVITERVYRQDSTPRLREDILFMNITYSDGHTKYLDREAIMRAAQWEGDSMRWILIVQ